MTGAVRVREAGRGDATTLAALHRRCFDRPEPADFIAALLGTPNGFALIAWRATGARASAPRAAACGPRRSGARTGPAQAATAAGFILCQVGAEDCDIISLGVAPGHRRAGLGGALLRAAMAEAAARGARRLVLEVAEDNEPARRLYASHGFALLGRRPNYYRGEPDRAVSALVMGKALGRYALRTTSR